MHLISQSDPELSKTLDAQRIRDILSHLEALSLASSTAAAMCGPCSR
jgi:hypothetical protein